MVPPSLSSREVSRLASVQFEFPGGLGVIRASLCSLALSFRDDWVFYLFIYLVAAVNLYAPNPLQYTVMRLICGQTQ